MADNEKLVHALKAEQALNRAANGIDRYFRGDIEAAGIELLVSVETNRLIQDNERPQGAGDAAPSFYQFKAEIPVDIVTLRWLLGLGVARMRETINRELRRREGAEVEVKKKVRKKVIRKKAR